MAAETPETPADIQETVEDIPQEPTETCADDSSERGAQQQSCYVALHTLAENPINDDEPVELQPAKKKPGRPAGSRNKGPPKPGVKKVVVSEAVEYAPPPPSPKRSQWDAQHQPIPTEAKTEMAELMLRLLSGQSAERQRRKDALRRSWFA